MSPSNSVDDVEKSAVLGHHAHLTNETVRSFSWSNLTVTVNDRATKQPLNLLSNVNGFVEAGEIVALMGPRYICSLITTILHSSLSYHVHTSLEMHDG